MNFDNRRLNLSNDKLQPDTQATPESNPLPILKIFHDKALDELGLQHKKAYFKDSSGTVGTPQPQSVNDLDSLDSLE